jgi:hypothetical protein
MDDIRVINAAELTAEQLEALEDEFDIPMPEWGSRGSVVRQMRRILEVGNGVPKDAYKGLSAKRMTDLVSLDDPNP